MKINCHSIFASATGMAASLVILHAGHVQAGPAEDYAEGAKHYATGDLVTAMPLLTRAAKAGNAAAQAALGAILDQADADEEAIGYFRKSAAQGNADGQFGLGVMLSSGEGAPKNLTEARKWITLAAEQGHKGAINELALAYINGGLDIPENVRQSAEALRWIRAAADNGYLTAMEKLAVAYRSGELGLNVDPKLAEQWTDKIRKASGAPKGRRNKRSTEK
ncbi:MAG: tetratricopeptide repeat protein [Sterolibacterium sp.]